MPQGNPHFLGLDLAFPNKPSAVVVLGEDMCLAYRGFQLEDDILKTVFHFQPQLVAIDAPLSLPQGLCCLEEACSCFSPNKLRKAERELARRGLGCFFTTKRSIIKPLVYRGMKLKERLEQKGYEVIEVYPYASKVRLWGERPPKKSSPEGLSFLVEKLSQLLPALPKELDHHLVDATIAAYTAYLHYRSQTEVLGGWGRGGDYNPLPWRAFINLTPLAKRFKERGETSLLLHSPFP